MIPRSLTDQINKALSSFPIISITGPRQSGKTTLVKNLFTDFVYLNLEALDVRSLAEEDPRRFILTYIDQGVVIDEVQRVPDLFPYLQTIVDERKQMGKVVLTGSQHFLLLESVTQSLAGRVMVFNLLPFTVKELDKQLSTDIDEVIFHGMYPPLYDRKIEPTQFYPTYLQTYVERDVRLLRNIGDLSTFTRFLRLCAGRIGNLLNMSSLAIETGVDHKTVRSWLSVLEASYIIFFLHPYHRNYNKRIVKQPKLYFYDTGLASSLLGLENKEQISTHYLRGGLFENFIIAEYRKMITHKGIIPNIWFWRDNAGTEIDLIIERTPSFIAVEIKAGSTLKEEFTRSLIKFANYSGISQDRCHVVYAGKMSYSRKKAHIWNWHDFLSI